MLSLHNDASYYYGVEKLPNSLTKGAIPLPLRSMHAKLGLGLH